MTWVVAVMAGLLGAVLIAFILAACRAAAEADRLIEEQWRQLRIEQMRSRNGRLDRPPDCRGARVRER